MAEAACAACGAVDPVRRLLEPIVFPRLSAAPDGGVVELLLAGELLPWQPVLPWPPAASGR